MTATTSSTDQVAAATLTGVRRGADSVFALLAGLFVLAVLAQVYLAGVGAFGHDFGLHEDMGNALGVAAVVLFLISLVARAGRWTMVGALVLALLTELAQHGLADGGHDNRWVGGVHAFDGMLILGLASWLAWTAYRRRVAR